MALQVIITKASTKDHTAFIEVEPERFTDEVYQYLLMKGLEPTINSRMTKVGAITKLTGKELKSAQDLAMKIAQENLDDLYAGNIKHSRAKAKSTIPAAVMAEARRLAKFAIKDAVRAAGLKPSHYDEKAYTAKANELISSDPYYLTQAKENIEARKTPTHTITLDIAKDLGPAKAKATKSSALPAGIIKPAGVQATHKPGHA